MLIFINIKMWFFFTSVTKKLLVCCQKPRVGGFLKISTVHKESTPNNRKNKAEWILQVQSFWQEDYTAEGAVALCYFFPSSISIAVAANYSKMSL